jgi:FKBP-type peptidyl-prolyl cis-trans isomerase FkpA
MRRTLHALSILSAIIAGVWAPIPALAQQRSQRTMAALEPAIGALDFLQIDYQIVGDGSSILFSVPRGFEGATANLVLSPVDLGTDHRQWFRLEAPGMHDMSDGRFPGVARRALLEAGKMMDSDVQFTSSGLSGRVDARVLIPVADGRVAAPLLKSYIEMIVSALDSVQPVLARAGSLGQIDWPALDRGPSIDQRSGELSIPSPDGTTQVPVPWAPWIQERIYASTVITSDRVGRDFANMTEDQRESVVARFLGDSDAARMWADHLKQTYPPIKIRCWGLPGMEVSVRAVVEGFSPEVTASGVIDEMYFCDVRVAPDWDIEALAALKDQTRTKVRYSVECGGKVAAGVTEVTIEPSSIADLGLRHMAVAQYVNEDHPWVRSIISDANSLGIAPSLGFTGSESYVDCAKQLLAVWTAFRSRGISYVGITASASPKSTSGQTVRQFHDAISERGANCADGAAAFASVFRKLGFDVWLIYPKGHVLVGIYRPDPDPALRWLFVETTALGDVEPEPPPSDTPVLQIVSSVPERHRNENLTTFLMACALGHHQHLQGSAESMAHMESLRELGMRPIPVSRKELGLMPPPPEGIEEMRESLRVARRREKQSHEYLVKSASVPNCVPYDSELRIREDIDAIESDPAARRRLLAAVEGDGRLAQFARVCARHEAIFEPAVRSAMKKFGHVPFWGVPWFGIAGSPWEIEVERMADEVIYHIRPTSKMMGRTWMRAAERDGVWHITESSIVNDDDLWLATALVDLIAAQDPARVEAVSAELKERVEQGRVPSVESFVEQYYAGIATLYPTEEQLHDMAARAAAGRRDDSRSQPVLPSGVDRAIAAPSGGGAPAPPQPAVATEDRQAGTGPAAEAGDRVELHYICRLADGTLIFDSKERDGKPRSFTAGGKAIPTGIGIALIGAREGMVRHAVLPPELAYGVQGRPASNIPPNAELHYEFTVVRVVKK